MTQRLVTITVGKVGSKDLIRQKGTLIRLMGLTKRRRISEQEAERLEGLLNFLDACTDQIKDGTAITTEEGPENWEKS